MTSDIESKIDQALSKLRVQKRWSKPKPFVEDKVSYHIVGKAEAKAALLEVILDEKKKSYIKGGVDEITRREQARKAVEAELQTQHQSKSEDKTE